MCPRFGGGIDNFNGIVRFIIITLPDNSASSCGEINDEDGTVSQTSSTLVGSSGGGLCGFGSASVDITNTLIASSTSGANCSGNDFFNTADNNLDTDGSCLRCRPAAEAPHKLPCSI
jgi:hypothetical protein